MGFIGVSIVVLCLLVVARSQTCSQNLTSPTGEIYNVASLIGLIAKWNASGVNGDSVNISICSNTLGQCYTTNPSGFCLYHFSPRHYDFIGNFATATPLANGQGVVLAYTNGEGSNSAKVTLVCNATAGPLSGISATINIGSVTLVTIQSAVACPLTPPINPCDKLINSTTGDSYNISALIGSIVQGLNATEGGDNFTLSVCTSTAGKCENSPTSGFCTYHKSGFHDHYCGNFAGITGLAYGKGVQLAYSGGTGGNSGILTVTCNPLAVNISNIRFIPYTGGVNYVSFESALACAVNENPNPCYYPFNSTTGDVYNIAPLVNTMLKGLNSTTGDNFTASICTNTVGKCSSFNSSGFCKLHQGHQDFIGNFVNVTGLPDGAGVNLSYPSGQDGNYGSIIINCAHNVPGLTFVSYDSNEGPNVVYAKSKHGCAADSNPCENLLVSSTDDVYDISALIGVFVQSPVTTSGSVLNVSLSICTNTNLNCSAVNGIPSGLCEYYFNRYYSGGSFNYAPTALPYGQGVALSYTGGDSNSRGLIYLICVPGGPDIGNVQARGSYASLMTVTIESGLACPNGTEIPPTQPSAQCLVPIVSSTGDIYNFSAPIGTLITASSPIDTATFNVSLCTDTIFCNSTDPSLKGVCREAISNFDYNAGNFQSITGRPFSAGVDLLYADKDYTTIVTIYCNPAYVNRFVKKDVYSVGFSTNITFESSYGCPVNRTDGPVPSADNNNNNPIPAPALPDYVLGLIIAAVVLLFVAVVILVVILVKVSRRAGYEALDEAKEQKMGGKK